MPAFRGIYRDISYDYQGIVNEKVDNPYVSANETCMTVDEIKQFLKDKHLLSIPDDAIAQRYWPGDKEENKSCNMY